MRVKKIIKYKFKLIKLELLNSKIYLQSFNSSNSLDLIELNLKKILKIIYDYHVNNRNIFFIGVPHKFQNNFSKTLRKTSHKFLPENIWINGLLSNQASVFKHLTKKSLIDRKLIKYFLKIKTKPNLIVLFQVVLNSKMLSEIKKLRIPVIIINIKNETAQTSLYKVPESLMYINKKLNNIFFILLNSILKK